MGINLVLKYFASIGVLIGILNTYFVYKRMKKTYQNVEDEEINNIIKWYGIIFTIPFLLMQVFQLLGKYQTVFYIFLLDFNKPFYIMGFVSMILFWALLVYLVIIKNGAEIIAKYNKAFGNLPSDKLKIKIFVGLIVLIVLIGLFILLFGNEIMGGAFSQIEGLNIL